MERKTHTPASWWALRPAETLLGGFLCYLALIGAAWIIYSIANGQGQRQANFRLQQTKTKTETNDAIAKCFRSPVPEQGTCITAAIQNSIDDSRSASDLIAQQEQSSWAFFLLLVGFAQLPLGILGFLALLRTIKQSETSISLAKTNAKIELRAWLDVNVELSDGLSHNGTNKVFPINVTVTNNGNTPARDVKTWSVASHGDPQNDINNEVDEMRLETCPWAGRNVFPGETWNDEQQVLIDENALVLIDEKVRSGRKISEIYIIVVIEYKTVFDDELRHITAKVYEITGFGVPYGVDFDLLGRGASWYEVKPADGVRGYLD